MRKKVTYCLLAVVIISNTFVYSQYNGNYTQSLSPDLRTSPLINPKGKYIQHPHFDYPENSAKVPRHIVTPNGTYTVSPSFRIHPRNAGTQSETIIKRHPGNAFIMFGSANTFDGQELSTGSYTTTNGGLDWWGNDTLLSSSGTGIFNFGDPAPFIDKNGRIIISYIALTGRIGASFSANLGTNWSNTTTFPGASSFGDKNLAETDYDPTSPYYGRGYVVFSEFAGQNLYKIVRSYTTNGGSTWVTTSPVSPLPSSGHINQGCDVAAGPGGVVYIVWTTCIIDQSNSTEDSLGFAKSTNGGVNWTAQSNHAVDMNGIRAENLFNGIRGNGFPRIDVDRTECGPRRGWIYVVTAEKRFYPAVGAADIVLTKSTNGGVTWSRIKVNQNTDTSDIEYHPALRVDETGDINVVYYSTRNSAGNTEAEVFVSRSTDGGLTFTDILISDHMFSPSQIPGTSAGYQGDYIGITSGNGKIWLLWMENGVVGRYQAWAASLDMTGSVNCLASDQYYIHGDFKINFPPNDMYLTRDNDGDNSLYFIKKSQSAFGVDTGCAMFDAYNAPAGIVHSLQSFDFIPVPSNTYLTFDQAYAPHIDSLRGPDSLIVMSSTNSGSTFITHASLYGSKNGGSLNTSIETNQSFTPTSSSWASKMYLLPVGTNKVKLKFISGNGNNIYIDNIKVRVLPVPATSNISFAMEGFYDPSSNQHAANDTVRIYLHRADFPTVCVDSAVTILDNTTLTAQATFNNAVSGNYFIKINHRNTIETWSKSGGESFTRGSAFSYSFLSSVSSAYQSNMKQIDNSPIRFGLFCGDINQDGGVDVTDIVLVKNDAAEYVTGYVPTDLTGDDFVDAVDVILTHNNSSVYVVRETPAD